MFAITKKSAIAFAAFSGFLLLVLFVVWKLYDKFARHRGSVSFVHNADEVADGIWLGNRYAASDIKGLQRNGVTHVLNMAYIPPAVYVPPVDKYREHNIEFLHLPAREGKFIEPGIDRFWPEAHAFMDAAIAGGGKVLVHCHAGRNRSASTVISYIMANEKRTLQDVLRQVQGKRGEVNPLPDNMAILRKL